MTKDVANYFQAKWKVSVLAYVKLVHYIISYVACGLTADQTNMSFTHRKRRSNHIMRSSWSTARYSIISIINDVTRRGN